MKTITEYVRGTPISILLLVIPFVILAEVFHWGPTWVFALSAIAIIPMANLIGQSTEVLAAYTGPRIGGLLNATLGNAAELIIAIVAIRAGLLELVKASITGSILGNILLVMGMSMVLGGVKNGVQSFDSRHASRSAILLMLAVIALLIPSILSGAIGPEDSLEVEALSLGVAFIMVVLYGLGVFYSLRATDGPLSVRPSVGVESRRPKTDEKLNELEPGLNHHPAWSLRTALILLAIATAAVAYLSEVLVVAIESAVISLGISEFFIGIILIPLVGNVAEHLVAVKVAIQNQMDLSVEIALASSLQIALFVAPFLVFVSLLLGNPLTLIFTQVELLALIVGVLIAAVVAVDGRSNWLEGAELLAVYLILALAFFLLPI